MTQLGPCCYVHFADVICDSTFLKNYLNNATGLSSHIVPFDTSGSTPGEAEYECPHHFSIICEAGDLDFIADSIRLGEH